MNRTEFEMLRNLRGKRITGDIRLSRRNATAPALIGEDIRIVNDAGTDLRLTIHHNPRRGSTTFNVHLPGVGPICRLDVDGTNHGDAGRSHKHSLQTDRCPDRNLPDGVLPRPDLSGRAIEELWAEFCETANIEHDGQLIAPDGGGS